MSATTAYDYDLEFLEDGRTIELISIGIVAEDGREYYAVNSEMPTERIEENTWLMFNVAPSLPISNGSRSSIETRRKHGENLFPRPSMGLTLDLRDTCMKPRFVIANEVRDFLLAAGKPVLWADYGAYDHVALCQLWGAMVALPEGLPMFTCDIQQEALRLGVAWDELPQQESGQHNALEDARHNRVKREFLAERR